MRIVVFGLGKFFDNHKKDLYSNDSVVAFIDNVRYKESKLYGCPVYSPDSILSLDFDFVVIMSSKFANEMKKQLITIGLPECKIVNFELYMTRGVLKQYLSVPKNINSQKKVLIIIDELSYQGGSVAVCYAARALQNLGVYVEVLCYRPNLDFIREQLNYGFIVNVYENLMNASLEELWWLQKFDVALVNTLQMSLFAKCISQIIKTFLWIHEPKDYYTFHAYVVNKMQSIGFDGVNVLTVSSVADESFKTYFPKVNTKIMFYGIEDVLTENNDKTLLRNFFVSDKEVEDPFAALDIPENKIVVATIANVCKRKAQDLFSQAVTLLTKEEQSQCCFLIIGMHYDREIDEIIDSCIQKCPSLYSIGQLSRKQLLRHFNEIDIFVCPSREDPLPICMTEGMAAGKICIASNKTGTSKLITPYENGLICEPDAQSIYEQIHWCLENKDKWSKIKSASRKIYDDQFSLDAFGKRLYNNILGND